MRSGYSIKFSNSTIYAVHYPIQCLIWMICLSLYFAYHDLYKTFCKFMIKSCLVHQWEDARFCDVHFFHFSFCEILPLFFDTIFAHNECDGYKIQKYLFINFFRRTRTREMMKKLQVFYFFEVGISDTHALHGSEFDEWTNKTQC